MRLLLLSFISFLFIGICGAQRSKASLGVAKEWNETSLELTLGTQRITYGNRVDVAFDASNDPVMIYSFEKDGTYLQTLSKYWSPINDAIHLKGLYFLDFKIVDGYYYVLAKELAGYTGNGKLEYEEEGHVLILLKVSQQGQIIYKKKLLGHEGVTGGKYFLCTMSGLGELAFDGTYFHVFAEICGNFSPKGSSEFDVHEGDYYLTLDKNGIVREDGRRAWMHSHSGLLQLTTDGTGQAFALSVGDAHPYGVTFNHFSNGKKVTDEVVFPDQTKLPYKDMYKASKSSTEAGIIGGLVQIGSYFYTVIATVPVEKHPTLKQPKDLLFLKFDKSGNVLKKQWIGKTPTLNETVPKIIRYGDQIFMASMLDIGDYQNDYKATVSMLNTEGEYVMEPKLTTHYLDYQSRLMSFPNGDVGLISIESYASDVEITRFGKGRLFSLINANEAQIEQLPTGGTSTVSLLLPSIKEQGTADINLTKSKDDNTKFKGGYSIEGIPDPNKGLYINGEYSYTPTFSLYLDEMDYSNFTVETEFMVSEYQDAPVFSMSRSSRYLNYTLTKEGGINLELNNGDIIVKSDKKYQLNAWHKAKVELSGTKVSVYLDGELVLTKTIDLAGNKAIRSADFCTTSFNNGSVLKGYLRYFKVN